MGGFGVTPITGCLPVHRAGLKATRDVSADEELCISSGTERARQKKLKYWLVGPSLCLNYK